MKEEISRLKCVNSRLKHESAAKKVATDNKALLRKIEQAENMINNFREEREQSKRKINDLEDQMQAADLQSIDINLILEGRLERVNRRSQELEITTMQQKEDIKHLREEIQILQQNKSKLQETEKILEGFKTDNEHLRTANSELKIKAENLSVELEASKLNSKDQIITLQISNQEEKKALASECSNTVRNLQQALGSLQEEKKETHKLTESQKELEYEIKQLRVENYVLQDNTTKLHETEEMFEDLKSETGLLGAVNYELKIKVNDLSQEIEVSKLQAKDILRTLETVEEEKKAPVSEYSTTVSKLREADTNIKELGNDREKLRDEHSNLLRNTSKLQHKQNDLDLLKAEMEQLRAVNAEMHIKIRDLTLKKAITAAEEEKSTLISDISVFNNLFQQSEKTTDDLKGEIKELRPDISQKQFMVNDLNVRLEAVNYQLTYLSKVSVATEEEKTVLTPKIAETIRKLQQPDAYVRDLEDKLDQLRDESTFMKQRQSDLNNQNCEMGKILEEAREELVAIRKKLEEVQAETSCRILTMKHKEGILSILKEKNVKDGGTGNIAIVSTST